MMRATTSGVVSRVVMTMHEAMSVANRCPWVMSRCVRRRRPCEPRRGALARRCVVATARAPSVPLRSRVHEAQTMLARVTLSAAAVVLTRRRATTCDARSACWSRVAALATSRASVRRVLVIVLVVAILLAVTRPEVMMREVYERARASSHYATVLASVMRRPMRW